MDDLLGVIISKATEIIVLSLAGIITTFAAKSYNHFMSWLKGKAENQKTVLLQTALQVLHDVIKSAVDQAEQTLVYKETGGTSKLTPEAAEKIRTFVINTSKANMPNDTLATLSKYGVDIDSIIVTFLEQSVLQASQAMDSPR